MKKNLLLFLSLFCFIRLDAQFQKYYFTSVTDRNAEISVLSSGNILVSRQTIDAGKSYFQFIKTNDFGDTLWTRSDYDSLINHYYCIRHSGNDQFYIGGSKLDTGNISSAVLMKSDSSGNILWSKKYPDSLFQSIQFLQILSDGNLLLLGRYYHYPVTHYGVMAKTDSIGNVIWTSKDTVGSVFFTYAIEMPDHGFTVAGRPYYSNEFSFTYRFDSTGNTLWRRTGYGGAIKSYPVILVDTTIISISFMPYYVVPGLTINKYDLAGNNILNRIIDFPQLKEVNEIAAASNFGYLVTGVKYQDYYNSVAVVYKLDSAFNIEWEKDIDNYLLENATTAIQVGNHYYFIMANVNSHKSDLNGFSLTKLDTIGNVVSVEMPQKSVTPVCLVYPNPFSISATLTAKNPENKMFSIAVYNVFGKIVYEGWFTTSSLVINRNNLSTGIYFYRLTDGSVMLSTGKLVID